LKGCEASALNEVRQFALIQLKYVHGKKNDRECIDALQIIDPVGLGNSFEQHFKQFIHICLEKAASFKDFPSLPEAPTTKKKKKVYPTTTSVIWLRLQREIKV
jgi:hypothetical protein